MKAFAEANWDTERKSINVAGGETIPILGTVELNTLTGSGEIVPLVWAIYDDADYIIILGSAGMRQLGFECTSPKMNKCNLFDNKKKSEEIAAKLYETTIRKIEQKVNSKEEMKPIKMKTGEAGIGTARSMMEEYGKLTQEPASKKPEAKTLEEELEEVLVVKDEKNNNSNDDMSESKGKGNPSDKKDRQEKYL